MSWLIIIGLMLLVVMPIFWLLPTAKQRQESRLRQHARQLGLHVNLAQLPQLGIRPEDRINNAGRQLTPVIHCGRYALIVGDKPPIEALLSSWRLRRSAHATTGLLVDDRLSGWYLVSQSWALSDAAVKPIIDCLERLPKDVLELESAPPELAAYWLETGKVEMVEVLADSLQSLAGGIKKPV